ncbi:MAG: serine protease [Paraburkholderia sp.]|uniref:S8 family serine peptidase n=1 Tax=Paraburkholderia sp. TaxID=1926495 RepID=UPI002B002D57|nr:S8 family serine peptidase [Paraburkholderia sp.]MEA3084585.1 serine protease [Paraburkholderia sp.]
MKHKRDEGVRNGSRRTTAYMGVLWSKAAARSVLASAAGISLSLALAACGASSASDTAPAAQEPVAAAASSASSVSSDTLPLETALKMNMTSLSPDASSDRFIVKYKAGTAERGAASAVQSKLDRLANAFPSKARHMRRMGTGADVLTTERKLTAKETRAFMRAIASDPDVDYVEPDTEMSTTMVPTDPEYFRQWSLASNLKPATPYPGIRAESAWDMANGSGSVIALVDNGVTSHADLDANILPGYDFTANNRGGNGSNPGITTETCSVQWHGTHVAGIMAAQANNGLGIAGIASAAKVVPVRVMNGCGKGYTSDIADGIVWAAGGSIPGVPANAHPARVINVSLGGNGICETTFQNAIDYAVSQGAVVTAAAGNDQTSATNFEPANCRNVINVGGSNRYGARWIGSNFGASVDLAAPADSIWSTYNSGTMAPRAEAYAFMNGTSMATPMVSAVIALAQSVAPTPLSAAEMRTLLAQNAQPFPTGQPDQALGRGILDANATVVAARSGKIPAAADFKCTESPTLMQVSCTDLSTARGVPIKSWSWNFGAGGADLTRAQSVNPTVNYDYPGIYEITLTVTDNTGAVSRLTRPFRVIPPAITDISPNVPTTFSASSGDMRYFALDVPAGVKSLTFSLAPGANGETGTLYLRAGTPSVLHPECGTVWTKGANATCTLSKPASGTYYGIVSATNATVRGASVLASYTQ